jgi:hypothetical protein
MKYDCSDMQVDTRIATTVIPFGAFVTIVGENCAVPGLTTDVTAALIGIALLDEEKPSGGSLSAGVGYAIGDPVRVMRRGRCWVTPEEGTAVAGFGPFARFTAAGGNVAGGIRSDADTAKAVAIPHAHYVTGIFDTVAVLELNLP